MDNKNKISSEKLLTDGYLVGVDDKSGVKPNANLEGGEHVKFPDGSVVEVIGDPHTKGGVDVLLPDMTKVVSDSKNLKLSKEAVKKLKKEYDIELTTKNTYSDAIDKYSKKIGLKKVLDDQEGAFKQLKKITENSLSEGTLRVNNEFLSKKIYDLEVKKQALQKDLGQMFEGVFEQQERQKGNPVPEQTVDPNVPESQAPAQDPTILSAQEGDFTEEEIFELGGQVNQLKSIASKYQISPRQGYEIMKSKGLLRQRKPQYDEGGLFSITPNQNTYSSEARERQKSKGDVYGDITTAEEGLNQLFRNFPQVFYKEEYKNLFDIQEGQVKIKEGVKLGKPNELVKKLQKDMDAQMRASAETVIKDETGRYSAQSKQYAQKYLEQETFGEGTARGYDGKLGNFTSGRYSLRADLVTPDERKALNDKGIYTYRQLEGADVEISPESKQRIEKFKEGLGENADFSIDTYVTQTETPTLPVVNKEEKIDAQGRPIQDNIVTSPPKSNFPRLFYTPDQSLLPPSGVQPESLQEINLGRIDPVRVGIEDNLQKINDSREFATATMESLPPSQRASVMANFLATSQATESDAITKANQVNAQNVAQAELFNIGQSDRENVANAGNRLNYEARALRGLDLTEQNIRNYFMANREIALNNYKEQIKLNTIDNLFPDVSLDFFGTATNYDPQYGFQIPKSDPRYAQAVAVQQQRAAQVMNYLNK